MKMRKKKRLYQSKPRLPDAQEYAAWVFTKEEFQECVNRMAKYLESTREAWRKQLEASTQWAKDNPDAFKGVMCGPTK